MSVRRLSLSSALVVVAGTATCLAQNQPITSPQDAQCRDEARDTVLTAANPKRLTPFDLGAELYHACMRRLGAEPKEGPSR